MDNQQFEPVQNQSIWTIILPTIIITALIVGGGIWWWQKSSFEKEKETLQRQIEELENQVSETSDWKIYENEEYGYQLKYPRDWNIWEEPLTIGFSKTFTKNSTEFKCSFYITGIIQERYKQYIANYINTFDKWQQKESIINGYPVVKMTHPEYPTEVYYFLENDKGGFSFHIRHNITNHIITEEGLMLDGEYVYDQKCMDIFGQIISTFRLIE